MFAPAAQAAGSVLINEVSAANTSSQRDEDGEPKDWIELYNPTTQAVDLSGAGLSNKSATPFKWVFPAGASIPADGYLVVWASKKDRKVIGQPLHTNFNIDNGADGVFLTSAITASLDSTTPAFTKPNLAWCRVASAANAFRHCTQPTPGAANTGESFAAMLSQPNFSLGGGFYSTTQSVVLTTSVAGADIRYTLDGSDPTTTSLVYSGPVVIASRVGAANTGANIPSAPNYFYTPTAQEVYKGTVFRAATFLSGSLSSPIKTNTYFVDPDIASRYTSYPVISIAVDPPLFFSRDNPRGIYVPGPAQNFVMEPPFFGANFWQDLEVPISIEYFKPDRNTAFRVNAGADIAGNISRGYVQKSLDISFRDAYGAKNIDFKLFPDKAFTKFKRLRLRNSSGDFGQGQIRDQFASTALKDTGLGYRAYAPGVLFINGEYFGLIDIREKDNEDFIESNYGVNADTVDLLDFSNAGLDVMNGTATHYNALLQFVENNSLAIPANYAYVKTQMDVDNYAQWFAAEMYVGNWDWIYNGSVNNVRLWRPQTANGRWQWLLHDLDATFYQTDNPEPRYLPDYNMYPQVFGSNSAPGVSDSANRIMVALLQNPEFRNLYLNTISDQLNSVFLKARTTPLLNSMTGRIAPLIPEHFSRWRPFELGGTDGYTYFFAPSIVRAQQFIETREDVHVQHTQSFFGLTRRYTLTLNVNDANMGTLKMNSLNLSNTLTTTQGWQGKYFNDVPITVVALPKAGYRFVGWQGTSNGTQPTLTLSLANDAALGAVFEPVPAATNIPTATPIPATTTPTPLPTATQIPAAQLLTITAHVWATGFVPLANWEVSVQNSNGTALQTATTGLDGTATLALLVASSGSYRICQMLQPGWANTYPNQQCYYQTLIPGSYSYDFVNAQTATSSPTATPTTQPAPTSISTPTAIPTSIPTSTPTSIPTSTPTAIPTASPTAIPAAPVSLTVKVATSSWAPLVGWAVTVTDTATGQAVSQQTNAAGVAQFGLAVGRYQVCQTLQANWVNTYPNSPCYYQTLSAGATSLYFLNALVAPTSTSTPTVTSTPTTTPTSTPTTLPTTTSTRTPASTATSTSTPPPTRTPVAPTNTPTNTPTVTPRNLAVGKTVVTSSSTEISGVWGKQYANDGLASATNPLGWSSNNTLTTSHTEWLSVDLSAVSTVNQVVLMPRLDAANVGYGFPVDFVIEVSQNNINWTTVVSRIGYARPAGVAQSFVFTAALARYVRITGTKLPSIPNDANKFRMQFAEVQVFGTAP